MAEEINLPNQTIEQTISFKEDGNKWTSFWPYTPDMMEGMNNTFYSFRDGELYEHDAGETNTFYGIYYPSIVEVIFNDLPEDDKVWNALMQEGDEPWQVDIETNLTSSAILQDEFKLRESRWFAYMRRNDIKIDLKSVSTIGLGKIISYNGNDLVFNSINERLNIGDIVHFMNGDEVVTLGSVESYSEGKITLAVREEIPVTGKFCFATKAGRNQGSRMRGYFMKVRLTSYSKEEVELFATNVKYDKSFV